MAPRSSSPDATPVILHVSSLIGYVRVALTTYSFMAALDDYRTAALCYSLSFVLDFFDGFFSRIVDGCANYHEILDVVTDRCSTAGLLMILAHLYPTYLRTCLFLVVLDVSSHWYHVYSTKGHHKKVDGDRNALLRLYYGFYPLFGYCCIGTELFYVLLYVLHFDPLHEIPGIDVPLEQFCFYVCLPACVLKNVVNVVKLLSAAHAIALDDADCDKRD